ncbi:hypothetical protein LTS18_011341, partial [Coniosporium uncinatum]
MKKKYPGLQISLAKSVADAFGFRNRTQVVVATAEKQAHSASHVEISFRDEYLARGDMWRLAIAELSQKTVYQDQKLLFMGTIKATVKNVYVNGQKKRSAYFAPDTKPIFRSESARFVLFLQMSREMWEFDVEGSGEIMFNKVINGFLPELFKNWQKIHARHLVSIVMFTRVEYGNTHGADAGFFSATPRPGEPAYKDFYRVVVSDMASVDWVKILYQLKKEFRDFLRDVSIMDTQAACAFVTKSSSDDNESSKRPEYIITGNPSIASRGNMLEAINLASSQFSQDYIDRDLVRTGVSIVVVSPGTGVFEVDYSTLKHTTEVLISNGIGIDLVCLSPIPLHSVPLFKYRNPRLIDRSAFKLADTGQSGNPQVDGRFSNYRSFLKEPIVGSPAGRKGSVASTGSTLTGDGGEKPGEWSFAMPHWLDVSFWKGLSSEDIETSLRHGKASKSNRIRTKRKDFNIRCRMYELQMMGVMENEMSSISISLLHDHNHHPWQSLKHLTHGKPPSDGDRKYVQSLDRKWMDVYDDNVFTPRYEKQAAEQANFTKRQGEARKFTSHHSDD